MLSNNITVCIFAWNEAHRIKRCISNFQGLFKILVVDNLSTDDTCLVAKNAGCDVITVKNDGYIETDKVMTPVGTACQTDYMLVASVSEFIPLNLLLFYADCANQNRFDVVLAYRKSITAGKKFPISGQPGPAVSAEVRFFKIGAIDYSNTRVHDRGRIVVPESRVANVAADEELHFYQFRDYDCSKLESTLCRYDDLLGKQLHERGEQFSLIKAVYYSLRTFFGSYLKMKGYRYGIFGLVHSYYRFHMVLTTWFRVWEWEKGYDRQSVLERNGCIRTDMEKDFTEKVNNFKERKINEHVPGEL